MRTRRLLVVLAATASLLVACGDDDTESTDTTTTSAADTTTTAAAPGQLSQPAVWPSADVFFDTPEAAAEDFVNEALGVSPELGEFMQGDSRSGEIVVFSPGEGDSGTPTMRSVLFVRQLGPDDGWFVIGAGNDNASITDPETMAEVPAGPLTVEGQARGFEGTVIVTAFVAGDADAVLDEAVTQGGSLETPEPYSVSLDLSAASPGDMITILVRGGVGLETDPGDFGAIPVTIEG